MKTLLTLTNGDTFIGTDYIATDEYSTLRLDIGLLTVDVEEVQSAVEIDADRATHVATPKKGSKLELATEIFKANAGFSRKHVIQLFVENLEMTPAGASTYYAKIKKGA